MPPLALAAPRLPRASPLFLGDEQKNHGSDEERPRESEHEIANSRHWTLKGYGGGPKNEGGPPLGGVGAADTP